MTNPAVVFDSLEQLIFSIGFAEEDGKYVGLEDDIRAAANCGRGSLLSLGILFNFRSARYSTDLISGLGFFPKLTHLHLTSSNPLFREHAVQFKERMGSFIADHHKTLKRLRAPTVSLDNLVLDQMLITDSKPLQLTDLSVPFREIVGDRPVPISSFGRYADTLTTLMLCPTIYPCHASRGLDYREVVPIIESLSRPSHPILLRRLMLKVAHLSPELFDLFSRLLVNLHTLQLEYTLLLGGEGLTTPTLPFRRVMNKRRYNHWKLQTIHIYSTQGNDLDIMQFLAERIPSVRSCGIIDWSDIRLEQLPRVGIFPII
ncbi:hypothetical protein BDN72DRAFT_413540 [Pluteus cervinus]|uniref:Uncharacterized protein n=1 Tax=Pluteus cervinus TaxID=181527 RepID=A0ACD3A8A4_9AGAR|nr:hypothetical protein BDN72DRAFT_413540 [Pluteus cervinus]